MLKAQGILPLTASILIGVSMLFPYHRVTMRAATYPERDLEVLIYADRFTGDVREVNIVGGLLGLKLPPPIPEATYTVVPRLILAGAALSAVAAFVPRLVTVAALYAWGVLIGLIAFLQYAMYLFGHTIDPSAPLKWFKPFTPPVVGWTNLRGVTTVQMPWVGGLLFLAAVVLLTVAARQQRSRGALRDGGGPGEGRVTVRG